ncbi:DUF4942 domain-containing protein [Marinobacter sp.]|uniref:DUF4942 domain-containing protein n=1 Tax=Marinobacter sp. TaxID=50741 RepID=UPI00356A8FEA
MNAKAEHITKSQFFAPASTDMVDGLIGRYQEDRRRMECVVEYVSGDDFKSVVGYFEDADRRQDHRSGSTPSFNLERGLAALNASYWQQALSLTDVLDFMPTNRREEWFDLIHSHRTPEFEESAVRATLSDLLAKRMDFLAEKVDGIFRALSKTHVTNQPEGFGKRMILTGVTDGWGSYGRAQTGHINDLRQVIAKLMGRDEPDWNASNRVVEIARANHRGKWVPVDGGALRIRCYMNGNAHLEVHPDMAWRLNEILHHLYPTAIPSRFRQKTKRKVKEFTLMERPLPFAVLDMLHRLGRAYDTAERSRRLIPNAVRIESRENDKHVVSEVEQVLELLGGVKQNTNAYSWYQFDYDPDQVIKEIVCTGVIPDQKSHQFYPTPEHIARDAVELAEIGPEHDCLEPSAGIGNLADYMGCGKSLCCIEASALHCAVLEGKGLKPLRMDYLKFSSPTGFDRIVMNPPYSQGRWQAHIEHAATMLRPDGVLVAILPASAKGKDLLPGMSLTWSKVYENQFRGASVDVVIMRAEAAK